MEKIQAILFDFGGTLDGDGIDWFTRIYAGVAKRVPGLDGVAFAAMARAAADGMTQMADTPTLSMAGTVGRMCEKIHAKMVAHNGHGDGGNWDGWEPDEVAGEFMADAQRCLERNLGVMEKLQGRFRLGCISNNWGNVQGWCEQYSYDRYFETMIDSALVGSIKPDKVIFQTAMDAMKIPAAVCAYVGDKFDCDVQGSYDMGMTPIWITGENMNDQPVNEMARPPISIRKLPDLLALDW
ncbi:MAG: HAD family hydrolase [Phycisphaerae bacterium]|nr:HAD family hydrolase [Phycisphaerae bacterium]